MRRVLLVAWSLAAACGPKTPATSSLSEASAVMRLGFAWPEGRAEVRSTLAQWRVDDDVEKRFLGASQRGALRVSREGGDLLVSTEGFHTTERTLRGIDDPIMAEVMEVLLDSEAPPMALRVDAAGVPQEVRGVEAAAAQLGEIFAPTRARLDALAAEQPELAGVLQGARAALDDGRIAQQMGADQVEDWTSRTAYWIGAELEPDVWYEHEMQLTHPLLPEGAFLGATSRFLLTAPFPCFDGAAKARCVTLERRVAHDPELGRQLAEQQLRAAMVGAGAQEVAVTSWSNETVYSLLVEPDTLRPWQAYEQNVVTVAFVADGEEGRSVRTKEERETYRWTPR